MPCISGKNVIICYNNIYKFRGFLFEWHDYFGCTELTKKGNPRKRSSKEYYEILDEFMDLPKEERDTYKLV